MPHVPPGLPPALQTSPPRGGTWVCRSSPPTYSWTTTPLRGRGWSTRRPSSRSARGLGFGAGHGAERRLLRHGDTAHAEVAAVPRLEPCLAYRMDRNPQRPCRVGPPSGAAHLPSACGRTGQRVLPGAALCPEAEPLLRSAPCGAPQEYQAIKEREVLNPPRVAEYADTTAKPNYLKSTTALEVGLGQGRLTGAWRVPTRAELYCHVAASVAVQRRPP